MTADDYAWTTPTTADSIRDRLAAAWSPVSCCDCGPEVHHDGRCALCPCRGNDKEGDAQ